MSIKIMTAVWESNVGPAVKRLILLALADSANDEGVCWPTIRTLQLKAGCSRTSAEDALRTLETEGLISRRAQYNSSNVYTVHADKLTSLENRGTPEKQGTPPPDSGGTSPENQRDNRKGTQREPKTPADAAAPGEQEALIPAPQKPAVDEENPSLRAINKRATLLAQEHYERLGKMGNVPAFMKIIKQAVVRDFPDEAITHALAYIAENNWTLTAERLANTLRGGPKLPSRRPNDPTRTQPTTRNGMKIEG